jgi:hypothetical protein
VTAHARHLILLQCEVLDDRRFEGAHRHVYAINPIARQCDGERTLDVGDSRDYALSNLVAQCNSDPGNRVASLITNHAREYRLLWSHDPLDLELHLRSMSPDSRLLTSLPARCERRNTEQRRDHRRRQPRHPPPQRSKSRRTVARQQRPVGAPIQPRTDPPFRPHEQRTNLVATHLREIVDIEATEPGRSSPNVANDRQFVSEVRSGRSITVPSCRAAHGHMTSPTVSVHSDSSRLRSSTAELNRHRRQSSFNLARKSPALRRAAEPVEREASSRRPQKTLSASLYLQS